MICHNQLLREYFSSARLQGEIGVTVGGGGLLSIPFLIWAGLPPHTAITTNRFGSERSQNVLKNAACVLQVPCNLTGEIDESRGTEQYATKAVRRCCAKDG